MCSPEEPREAAAAGQVGGPDPPPEAPSAEVTQKMEEPETTAERAEAGEKKPSKKERRKRGESSDSSSGRDDKRRRRRRSPSSSEDDRRSRKRSKKRSKKRRRRSPSSDSEDSSRSRSRRTNRRRRASPGRRRDSPPRRSRTKEKRRSRSRSLSWSPPPAVRRQMEYAEKMRKAKEANEAEFGRFYDGYRWVEKEDVVGGTATLGQRRVTVQNLPPTIDEPQLRAFLAAALGACGVAMPEGTTDPAKLILSVWLSNEKKCDRLGVLHARTYKFAFVQLATIQAAETAIGLSGISCMGNAIKVETCSTDQIGTANAAIKVIQNGQLMPNGQSLLLTPPSGQIHPGAPIGLGGAPLLPPGTHLM